MNEILTVIAEILIGLGIVFLLGVLAVLIEEMFLNKPKGKI